jgi:peptide/nickel transport system substrate-binding protein
LTYAPVGPAAAQRLRNDKSLTVLASPGPSQQVTHLNTKRRPFDDVRVRQAIALAVDRQAAIERSLNGEGRLTGPMPAGHGDWALRPDPLPYRKDLATATQLLAEAGYPDGFESTIKTSPDNPTMLKTSIALADQVKAIGITLNVEQLDWSALVSALEARDFDLLSHENGFRPDPDGYFHPQYHSKSAQNLPSWEHAQYDEIVEAARATLDPGQRKRLYDDATTILLNEAPSIWWFTENNVEVIHTSVKGYSQSFSGRRTFLKKTWLDS